MMRKILSLVLMLTVVFSFLTFTSAADQDLQVSNDTLNFGHEGTEKTLYLTNTNQNSDLLWSVATNVPWIKLEASNGKIGNPSRIPANAPYQFSNMWPKLPQPWYFQGTAGIGIDHEGGIYVLNAFRIHKFNKYGEFLFSIGKDSYYDEKSGKDILPDEMLRYPRHIAFDSANNFYVTGEEGVKKFDKNGKFLSKNYFSDADDVAVDSQGNVYITVLGIPGVLKFDKNGKYLQGWGKSGLGDGEFVASYNQVIGIVIDSRDFVYVADNHYRRIQKFDVGGKFIKMWAVYANKDPREYIEDWQLGEVFAIDSNDIIYIGDEHSGGISKFDTEGRSVYSSLKYQSSSSDYYVNDAAVDKKGGVYYASPGSTIFKLLPDGRLAEKWDSSGVNAGEFYSLKLMGINKSNKTIYTYDRANRFQIFNLEGKLVKIWDLSQERYNADERELLYDMEAIAFDSANTIYIMSRSGPSILKFDTNGNLIKKSKFKQYRSFIKFAADSKDNFYVLATITDDSIYNVKFLLKLDKDLNIINEWELKKILNGNDVRSVKDIVIDSRNNLYLDADDEDKIIKLNSNGELIKVWQFSPEFFGFGFTIDSEDNFYVSRNYGFKKFDADMHLLNEYSKESKKSGYQEGSLNWNNILIGLQGNVYVLDYDYNRIQVLSQAVQQIKVTVDRSKLLASETNTGWVEFKNDRNPAQPPIRVEVTALQEVIRDITPPAVTITFPQANATVSAKGFSFLGTATDASGIQEVAVSSWDYARRRWTLYNQKAAYSPQTTAWSFNLTKDILTPGSHLLLWAKVTDTKGNVTKKSVLVQVEMPDTTPPEILITTPEANSIVPLTGFVLGGYAFDPSGIAGVFITVSNETKRTWPVAWVRADFNKTTSQWSLLVPKEACIAGDTLKLWVNAVDGVNNWYGWKTILVKVAKDTTPPLVFITNPAPNSVVPSSGFTFSGSAFDTSGVSYVYTSLSNETKRTWPVAWVRADFNKATGQWNFPVVASLCTPGDVLKLWVSARDNAGNWSSSWHTSSVIVEQDSGIEPQRAKGKESLPGVK